MPRLYLFAEGSTELTFADTVLNEAYLFSDPSWFEYFYDHHEKQLDALKAIADGYASPELIDDGQHSAPSKRIIRELPDYKDAKSAVGPQVAELIGLETIRSKCPHFAGWLSQLERLGTQAPTDTLRRP